MRSSSRAMAASSTNASTGRELVAIEMTRLVGLDDRRLGDGGALPFAYVGMREQRFEVGAGGAARLDVVGLEAECDRRIEAVGDRIAAAKEGAAGAEAAPRFLPDLRYALDVRGERRRPGTNIDALANAHRHVAAQRRESRMH